MGFGGVGAGGGTYCVFNKNRFGSAFSFSSDSSMALCGGETDGGFFAAHATASVPVAVQTTFDLFTFAVGINSIDGATTVTLQDNAGDLNNTITIPALTTGIFRDTTNSDVIAITQQISYHIVGSGTVGVAGEPAASMRGAN